MRFFLDENFPKSCGEFLTNKGHLVFDIRGTSNEGIDDISIFTLAQENNSVFLTTDKDFFHTVPFIFSKHSGVIVFCFNKPNRKLISEKLEWVLNNVPLIDFNSKILFLRDNSYSIIQTNK